MALVQDIETTVGESDALSQQPPAAHLVLHPREVNYLLLDDLRYFHVLEFRNAAFG